MILSHTFFIIDYLQLCRLGVFFAGEMMGGDGIILSLVFEDMEGRNYELTEMLNMKGFRYKS